MALNVTKSIGMRILPVVSTWKSGKYIIDFELRIIIFVNLFEHYEFSTNLIIIHHDKRSANESHICVQERVDLCEYDRITI